MKIILSASTGNLLAFVGIFWVATSFASAKQQKRSSGSDQEKPEAMLAVAKKASETRAWRVDARIEADKQMNISGIVAMNDFDLTTETVDGTKRQITLGDKSWISEDGGKNWKNADVKDRRFGCRYCRGPRTFGRSERRTRLRLATRSVS